MTPLEQQLADARTGRRTAELRALRYEVAAETGLDPRLAGQLQGSTREELAADVERLKAPPLVRALLGSAA